ncbi:MAG: hypothetical protein WBV69_06550 [Candidatus Sulfotelmatobacter sp.]
MRRFIVGLFCTLCLLPGALLWGQSSAPAATSKATKPKSKETQATAGRLEVLETIVAQGQVANSFSYLNCDHDGNIYFSSDVYGTSAVHKLNPKGQEVALFRPNGNPDLKTIDAFGKFVIAEDGGLSLLVFPHEIDRYVNVYKPDGSFKSTIKLQPGFPWMASVLAVFPQGNLFVSGLEYNHDRTNPARWPFNGIFSTSGTLMKEVKLEDDETLHDLAAAGDKRVTSPTVPLANHSIEFSQAELARDGNVYLMRWTDPAIFYAISPGGEVVRRFTVDPGDSGYDPLVMHVSGSRIAVLFFQSQTTEVLLKVVDLEGHNIATYHESKADADSQPRSLGLGFACYTENPERFTFMSSGDDGQLQFLIAEAR